MALSIPSNAGFLSVDTSVGKTFQLPLSTDLIGRVITFKDSTGNAVSGPIQIQTQGGDTFQDGTTTYIIQEAWGSATFVSRVGEWVLQQGNKQILASSINATNITGYFIQTPFTLSSLQHYTDIEFVKNSLAVSDGALSVVNSTFTLPFNLVLESKGSNDVNFVYGRNDIGVWNHRLAANDSHFGIGLYQTPNEVLTLLSTGKMGIMTSSPQYTLDVSGTIFTSSLATLSVAMIDINSHQFNFLTTSSGVLLLNGAAIAGGGGGGGVSQLVAGSNISLNPPGGIGPVTVNVTGLPTSENLTSTVEGLGSSGYVSTFGLVSTTEGITIAILDLLNNLGSYYGYISSLQLISTVEGLGSSGYLSTGGDGVFSTVYINQTAQTAPFWDSNTFIAGNDPEPNPLNLDVFGSARILKNLYIGSTTTVLGTGGVATRFISSSALSASSINLLDPYTGVPGFLTISSGTLLVNDEPAAAGGGGGDITTANLTSTVEALGTIGYISSASLTSSFLSTGLFINQAFSSFSTAFGPGGGINTTNLTSTVGGLGQLYISSIPSLISTSALLTSSIGASTIQTIVLSSQQAYTSSLITNYIYASTSLISSLSTSLISFATGFGYLEMPDIYPNSVYTSTLTVLNTATFSTTTTTLGTFTTGSNLSLLASSINFQPPQTAVPTENFIVAASILPSGQSAISYDGITWYNRGALTGSIDFVQGLAWNGSLWVAVGRTGGSDRIGTSPDGLNWTGRSPPYTNAGYGIAWNGRIWVSGGYGGGVTLAYSLDGLSWISLGAAIFTSEGHGLAWNGFMFVATGSGTNTLAYSFDGLNWIGLGSSIFTSAGNGVAWNGSLWVAVGQGTNTIATSPDGITWTGRGASVFTGAGLNVAWNGSLWVAVGNGTNSIASSADGISWTGRTNTLTSGGRAIAWSGSLWIAGGAGTGVITTSPDGITWTQRVVPTLTSIGAIAARRVLPFVGTQNPLSQSNINIGAFSNITSLQYYGTIGRFNNTVLAEISTGLVSEELLIFKGSTTTDRVRVQTTGDVRFETGVSARLWNSNTLATLSNATPAMIINTSSNVGIQLLAPSFPLDVAGVIRGTTISTQLVQMSSIFGTQYSGSNSQTSSMNTIAMSSGTTFASSFTGRWNDAQYYVLQTI